MRNGTIAALLVIGILAGAGVGYLVGVSSTATTTSESSSATTQTITAPTENIGVIHVNGSTVVHGSSLTGSLYVLYPNASESGNPNAPITTASVTLDCNESFFNIVGESSVILSLTVIGNENFVGTGGMLNLTIVGNLNKIFMSPQPVMLYGEQINGTGNQLFFQPPLP